MRTLPVVVIAAAVAIVANAFVQTSTTTRRTALLTQRHALWRHWVDRDEPKKGESEPNHSMSIALAALLAMPMMCNAVSGGGLDYANIDITGQDFSNGVYKGKDFTQVIAKNTNFQGSNLQGCRFYKAYLVRI